MNGEKSTSWICPRCGKETTDFPAISRTDNKTEICSQCGIDEAMSNWLYNIQTNQKDK